jgi:hypothetical protein
LLRMARFNSTILASWRAISSNVFENFNTV